MWLISRINGTKQQSACSVLAAPPLFIPPNANKQKRAFKKRNLEESTI